MRMLCPIVVSVLLLGLTAGNTAQEFTLDVVSVRQGGGGLPQPMDFGPGRMALVDWPLRGLVWFAFAPPALQVEGWPDPRLRERQFTVEATYSGVGTPALSVRQRLVREILEDRFGMRVRIERREQPVYALRVFKPGVLGPAVVKVDYDCADPETRARELWRSAFEAATGLRSGVCFGAALDRWGCWCPGCSPHWGGPRGVVRRVVVDQTDLDGFYRFELISFGE